MTEAERRGVLVVVGLLLLGAGWDAFRKPAAAPPARDGAAVTVADSGMNSPPDSAPPAPPAEVLDRNRARAEDLERLPGVGPVLARRIAAHREQYGPFRSVDELLAVRGIGERLLERLRPRLRVAGP